MALLASKPDNSQFQFTTSLNFLQKFVPKNTDGTVMDCTGMTLHHAQYVSKALCLATGGPVASGALPGLGVAVADATGVTLAMAQSSVQSLCLALGNGLIPAQLTVGLTSGSDTVIVAQGGVYIIDQPKDTGAA